MNLTGYRQKTKRIRMFPTQHETRPTKAASVIAAITVPETKTVSLIKNLVG